MKKKIVGIFVCTLLIAVPVLSAAGTMNDNKTFRETSTDYSYSMQQNIDKAGGIMTNWLEQVKLTASDGAIGDYFGSVSISGSYAIIGAPHDDDSGSDSGSAYIFKRIGTTWTEEAKLLVSDGAAGDSFGWSVSINGNYAIIGAYFDDDSGYNSGSAYIFKRIGTTWTEETKLLASDGAAMDLFGYSVSINGIYAVVGASRDDDLGIIDSGSAYVFKRMGTTWTEEAKLLASDGAAMDRFGNSVSIDRIYAIVGAYGDDDLGIIDSGSAYVFKRSNQPPNAPTISGSNKWKIGTSYPYTFTSIDPDIDQVSYYIDWDDGTTPTWSTFQASGNPYSTSHTWNARGIYLIQAKAKDAYGAESGWATLQVTMPRNRVINIPFFNFLQGHPNPIPILRHLLQRLEL